jgi:hypothetical protein
MLLYLVVFRSRNVFVKLLPAAPILLVVQIPAVYMSGVMGASTSWDVLEMDTQIRPYRCWFRLWFMPMSSSYRWLAAMDTQPLSPMMGDCGPGVYPSMAKPDTVCDICESIVH